MVKLKLYIHTNKDLDKQVDTYLEVFDAKEYKRLKYDKKIVEKNNLPKSYIGKTLYANLELFQDINIMLSRHSKNLNLPFGANSSFIISFDTDKDNFNKTYENIKKSSFFRVQYDKNTWNTWGTQIVKFHDDFGYSWVLELDVRKVDNNWNPIRGNIKNHKSVDEESLKKYYQKQKNN